VEKKIKDGCIIRVMGAYNYKKGAESAIQVIRDYLRQYTYVTPFDEKITRSDKFWGLGGKAASKLGRDMRESNFNASILKNDAEVMEWLANLYKRISQSKNADPEFYKKAKEYLGQISEMGEYVKDLGPKEDRRAVGQGINALLTKMESDCGLKPLGESKTLTEQVYNKLEEKQKKETKEEREREEKKNKEEEKKEKVAKEKETAEDKKMKEKIYGLQLKGLQDAAKEAGVTEEEAIGQIETRYGQLKGFVLTYDSNKKNKAYEKQREGIKKAAEKSGLSEEEFIERLKTQADEMEEFLSKYNSSKRTKK
jgi:hypothetical protein